MIMKKKGILLAVTWAYTFGLHAQDYTFGLQPENAKPDRIETISNGAMAPCGSSSPPGRI